MAGKNKDVRPFGLAAAADSDRDFKQELEQMAEAYYDYLVTPLFFQVAVWHHNDGALTVFKRELEKVNSLVETGELRTSFIAEKVLDDATLPRIGARQLPVLFSRGHAISEVYDLVLSNKDTVVWKKRGYDIILEIEIAQCRALHRYKQALEARVKEANAKVKRDYRILSFKWLNGTDKLDKLYQVLTNENIIECKKDTFRTAFSNSQLNEPLNIWWILGTKGKYTNKAALFYLLDELAEKGYIHQFEQTGLIKTIENIFCNKDGKALENLGQSRANTAKGPAKQKIDRVINSLK